MGTATQRSASADLTTDFPEMNPEDPSIDDWHHRREDLQGDRPPGLIDLNRYPIAAGNAGIATFLQRPVALTPAGLRAAEVDVAILGAGTDMGFGMRGAQFGPRATRANDMYLPSVEIGLSHQHTRSDALQDLAIPDYEDAAVDPLSTYRSMESVREVVREIAETGAIPRSTSSTPTPPTTARADD